jgi:DNA-binding MarR family transcriptional regulator
VSPAADNDALARALAARLDRFERYSAESLVTWMESHEMALGELRVILALAGGEPMGGSAVAECAGVSVDVAYRAIHSLDARGWIDDQGRTHALNADGEEIVRQLSATRETAVRGYVDSLSPEERDELAAAFGLD